MIGYIPLAKMDTAHHMLLYSCGEPGVNAPVWNCGEMGDGSGKFVVDSFHHGLYYGKWRMVIGEDSSHLKKKREGENHYKE